jgi:hypothetical protein
VLAAASDPDGDSLSYSFSSTSPGLSTATWDLARGSFVWTPGYDQAGDHSVTFTFSDGTFSSSKTIPIKVRNTNRPPTLSSDPVTPATIGVPWRLVLRGSDPDGDGLTYSGWGRVLPPGLSVNSETGEVLWTPTPYATAYGRVPGTVNLTFAVSDGSHSPTNPVTIQGGER